MSSTDPTGQTRRPTPPEISTTVVITVPAHLWPAAQRALTAAGLALRPVATGPSQSPRYELVTTDPAAAVADDVATELSEREWQVLIGIASGKDNPRIGRTMGISGDTVKTHARTLFKRLGAVSRAHAVHLAHQRGLFDAGGEAP